MSSSSSARLSSKVVMLFMADGCVFDSIIILWLLK
jgi:hypothetical protein